LFGWEHWAIRWLGFAQRLTLMHCVGNMHLPLPLALLKRQQLPAES
jgi:hypothetical protein